MAILTELRDPRVRDVTVTYVEASGDLRSAKVYVSVMGDQTHQELSLRGLQNAAGFLQAKIAEQVDLRYTPRLSFVLDQGVKRSIEISQILKEVLPEPDESSDSAPPATDVPAADAPAVDAPPNQQQTGSGEEHAAP